jgi:peroxiredoxin Q/BCP
MTDLKAGDRAPRFSLPADGGGEASLKTLRGKKVVLYFYPKDDTAGCTQEALDFSTRIDAFHAIGAVVVGVSKDSVKKHDNFKAKHRLSVTLASDAEGDAVEAYGVWVEKSMYGRRFMGVERATFLIDAAGVIRRVWRKVRVAGHAEDVLKAARAL